MKEALENFDVLYFLAGVTCVSILLKFVGCVLYRRLLRDSNQMGTTDNKWMKSMMAKFEAYYKLRISVHNVENFVDRYIYHYHFLGLPLQSWEYVGRFTAVVTIGATALFGLAAGYYGLSMEWFMVMGFCVVSLLLIQGLASCLFNMHRSRKLFRIQLIDYMENTMRARLENEYFHQEATKEYQMEYFDSQEEEQEEAQAAAAMEKEEVPKKYRNGLRPVENQSNNQKGRRREEQAEAIKSQSQSQWSGSQIRDLLTALVEELQVDKDIEKKQQELSEYTASTSERAQLFEEILREYI